jgi:dipeptide/tripeptide permease
VTTPAQDAPLVFPSVAFRPVRLVVISVGITALAILAGGLSGHLMLGVFFGVGLLLGLLNALLVRRSVASITAKEHPLKSSMALNSATRLAIITVVALIVAYVFRPNGLGAMFGLALFQVLLVVSTALPVWKKLRTGESAATGSDAEGGNTRDD